MKMMPWDQQIARVLVRPFVNTPVSPNHFTTLSLICGVGGALLLATGDAGNANWGAGLFMLARFLDHFDGELARAANKRSRFGYYYDYVTGGVCYSALFLCMGIGFAGGGLGGWSIGLGIAGAVAAIGSMFLNLGIDESTVYEGDKDSVGYPRHAGFELEDGIYLLGPITWAGYLMPFFVAAGIGAGLYCLWSLASLVRARAHRATT
ncbi:MAG: CDP-alcohol phosphatidyltransferase family protein [Alphaproteobacteria bacterium]